MAIETNIKSAIPQNNITFPALYISVQTETVVLFTKYEVGMVVCNGRKSALKNQQVGYSSEHWESCTNALEWQRLPTGTELTITQKD